jgi:hypothetical protein
MKYAWFPLLATIAPFSAMAQSQISAGGVACLSLKQAKAYATQQVAAPEFAADLIARADCYAVREPADAIIKGKPIDGYQAYQLLSGHTVWLPVKQP